MPRRPLNARQLRRAKERGGRVGDRVIEGYKAIMQFMAESRFTEDEKRKVLKLGLDEVEDEMASETFSWADDVAMRPTAARKGRNEEY